MKLLFVHQNLGQFGGAEANIQLSGQELRRRGHQVALLFRQRTGREEREWSQTFEASYALPTSGHTETVEAVLDQWRPELIYLHNLSDVKVVEALLNSGIPVVRMVHDHALYCMRGYKYNYLTRRPCTRAFSPFCLFPCLASIARNHGEGGPFRWVSYAEKQREIQLSRRCQRLVVYSQHLKRELVQNGFAESSIELCVPLQMRGDERELSPLSSRNLVLFAGQLIRGKGVDVLLDALAKLRVPFECIILGDGSHRGACERHCRRLGLQDRVQFHGYVPPGRLKEYYLEASLFVMSSLWPEPFGLAGPEAMRYGLPVVAFDAGGIREWLKDGENGFLVPWKNTTRLAARIQELLCHKDLARRLGAAAAAWVQQYDATSQVIGLERLFHQVLRETSVSATATSASVVV